MKNVYSIILSLPVLATGMFFVFTSDSEAQTDASLSNGSNVMEGPLTDMEFVLIPSGHFIMGSPSNEIGREYDEERYRHRVLYIGSFELMTTEVTQGMWEEVMGDNPGVEWEMIYEDNPSFDYGVGDNYPVYCISWNDCQDFIDELNDMDPNHTYRLPTEAEWEFACRAGSTARFYWGNIMNENYCWYDSNSSLTSHPVGTKQPNTWGLYDMSGNVWEWCEDIYMSDYIYCSTDGRACTWGSGSDRVLRGGS